LFVVPPEGKPFAITAPVAVRNVAISPDGSRVALLAGDGKLKVYSAMSNRSPELVPTPDVLAPVLWADDGLLYVQHLGAYTQIPTRISRFHLKTGMLEPWREVVPSDIAGVNAITKVVMSRDTRTVVFNYRRVLSELFVTEPISR
jgi:hypothetical protein